MCSSDLITGFDKIYNIMLGKTQLYKRSVFQKIDINLQSYEVIKKFFKNFMKSELKVAQIFMHSYSMTAHNNLSDFRLDETVSNKFTRILKYLKNREDNEVVTFHDLDRIIKNNKNDIISEDFVPGISEDIPIGKALSTLIRGKYKENYY